MTNETNKVQHTHKEYTEAYVNILNVYKDQINSSVSKKNILKGNFFKTIKIIMYILTGLFVVSIIFSLILFGIMIIFNYQSAEIIAGAITTIISTFVTMTISIFKLPKIIANYLFNKKEDKLMNSIIKNIQRYEIKAIKYEIKNLKVEKLKQLNAEASNASNTPDIDITVSSYNTPTPSQNDENHLTELQNINNYENNNIS
jgi:hypothetical protein